MIDTPDPVNDLSQRIADCLGWKFSAVRAFSLYSLRELVRPKSPELADEISEVIRTGKYVTRKA